MQWRTTQKLELMELGSMVMGAVVLGWLEENEGGGRECGMGDHNAPEVIHMVRALQNDPQKIYTFWQ